MVHPSISGLMMALLTENNKIIKSKNKKDASFLFLIRDASF